MTNPLAVIHLPYRDDGGAGDDPMSVSFGQAAYRAETFVATTQVSRDTVRHHTWRVWIWTGLTNGEAETLYSDAVTAKPHRDVQYWPTTVAEKLSWDERRLRGLSVGAVEEAGT